MFFVTLLSNSNRIMADHHGRRHHHHHGRLLRAFSALVVFMLEGCQVASAGQGSGCSSSLVFLPSPYNNASALICQSPWKSFILRHSQSEENVLTMVLSVDYKGGWVGVGFSKNGDMVGSSALVGWIDEDGTGHMKQYYLGGFSPQEVIVNSGELRSTSTQSAIVLHGSTIYMALQLRLPAPLTSSPVILAYGKTHPRDYQLTEHEDAESIIYDFSAGKPPASSYHEHLKTAHGVLAILAWGVLLPIGAIIARFFRHIDPLWFQLHSVIQLLGFILGFATVICGLALYSGIHAHVRFHRNLGLFVLSLSVLQMMAYLIRPEKEDPIRKYWNWYHHWVGRLALFAGTMNIVIGIDAAKAGNDWRIGQAVCFFIIVVALVGLELYFCFWKKRKSKEAADAPMVQMQPLYKEADAPIMQMQTLYKD